MANINSRPVVAPFYGRHTQLIENLNPITFFADSNTAYPNATKVIYQNFGGALKEGLDLDILAISIDPSIQLAEIETGSGEADAMRHFLTHSLVELKIGGRLVSSAPLRIFTPQSVYRAPVSGGYIADIKDYYDVVPLPAPATIQSGEALEIIIKPAPGLTLATLAATSPHAPQVTTQTQVSGRAHNIQVAFTAIQYANSAGVLLAA